MAETTTSPERELALRAAAALAKREIRTSKALLRAEKKGLGGVRKAVRQATEAVATTATPTAVRRYGPSLQASVGQELLHARRDARREGRRGLETELDRVFPATFTAEEIDAAAAFVASSGVAAAWGSAALAAIAAETSLLRVPATIEPSVRRTVATEVARAFNDERHRIIVDLDELVGGAGDDGGSSEGLAIPKAGMFKVWSAVLDGKTCPRCFAADGEVVELHKSFKGGSPPPLHPFCRCVVEHVIVPKPERLEDISIDYDLFKQELRDVIREGRANSERHALGFVADSMGRKRSPLALTKRFAREDYARR